MTTTAPLEDLASYVPSLILRRLAGNAMATKAPSIERFPAAVLIADLSGFTALTEHLTQHSPAGAEALTSILDLYFGHLVRVVSNHGGDVVKFAGDGLLALWYGDEPLQALTRRAVQCGLAVQMTMDPDIWGSFVEGLPPTGLKVRVGVGAGEVTTMHLGGVFGRWELLITGEAITQAGMAEGEAGAGEVVIAPAAWDLVAEACIGRPLPSGAFRLESLADYLPMRCLEPPALVPEMGEALRSYLPKAIVARLEAGQTAWLAEQRRVTVLFINLQGLRADTPLASAQAMMQALQQALYRYEGSITRLGTDGKGPTVVAALGLPPLAHEDDPERGVRAAFAIHEALTALGFSVAIGVTSGWALCGAVGAPHRREYTMMGAMVNRSARLMQVAASQGFAGGPPILCDEATARAARGRLRFEPLPQLRLKGVAELVTIYRALAAEQPPGPVAAAPVDELIGREVDKALVARRVAELARSGSGGALLIEGEAGIGKSALLAYAREQGRAAGLLVLASGGSPVEAPPYQPWRPIFAELLAQDAPVGQESSEPPLFLAACAALAELGASDLAPLLGAVLPFTLEETPLTAQLAGQARADNTRALLLRLLARAAERVPLLIVIDDAQWLDASSWALLHAASAEIAGLLAVAATRPLAEAPPAFQSLAYAQGTQRLQLRGLPPGPMRALLARRLGVADLPDVLWELVAARAQGNPFVGEELLRMLRESGEILVADGVCRLARPADRLEQLLADGRLPATVQGLITSRIDRLSAAQQLTLKVASVIGSSFALSTLAAIHPVERDPERLVEQLFALQQAGLVVIEAFEPALVYAFKHTMGAEVAYQLMSFAQRRRLHRALAEHYEVAGGPPAVPPTELAHHWRRAEEPLRALRYLGQAGEEALRSGSYREAASFLGATLAIAAEADPKAVGASGVDAATLAHWERLLGEAYHGVGRLVESREQLERAVARLGFPVPAEPSQLVVGFVEELAQQAVRLILGRPLLAGHRAGRYREAAQAYGLLAQLAHYDGQLIPSIYAALRALNLAERAGPSPALAGGYAAMQLASSVLPFLAAIYRRRAQTAADRLGHLPTHGWVAEAQGLDAIGRGDWRRAQAALAVALAVGERLGDQRRRAEATAARALVYSRQGAYELALAGCDELQALGLRSGDTQVRTWGLAGAAENLLALGEDGRAVALLSEAEGLLTENFGGARAEELWVYGLIARAALRRGDHEVALGLARAAARLSGPLPPATLYVLGGYSAIAEVYLGVLAVRPSEDRASLRAAARAVCAGLQGYALIFPAARPVALSWEGLRLELAGRHAAARRRWARAAALAVRLGMPYDEARARYLLGRHTVGEESRRQLARAAALFERLGCAYDLAQVQQLLG